MLIAILAALAATLVGPAPAVANEDFAREPPFGGELPPPLVRPKSERVPPPGFELSGREAVNQKSGQPATTSTASQVNGPSGRSRSSSANSFMSANTHRPPDTMPIRLSACTSESPAAWTIFAARRNRG